MSTIDSNVVSPEKRAAAGAGTLAPLDVISSNPSWAWAAGAGISTTTDLVTFVEALVGGGLLGPTMQKTRLDSIRPLESADPQGPGFGLVLGRFGPFYGHTGELSGFTTLAGYDPERKNTVVVWTSLAPSPDGRHPAAEMARTIIGELYGIGS